MKKIVYTLFALVLLSGCASSDSGASMVGGLTTVIDAVKDVVSRGDAAGGLAEGCPEPEIRLLQKGSILPSTGENTLLISSVGYAKAGVRVKKVFSSNILQFLQYDEGERVYNLFKTAGQVLDTTIVLCDKSSSQIQEKRISGINLADVVTPEPGAIYRVEIRGLEPVSKEKSPYFSETYSGSYDDYDLRHTDLIVSDLALLARKGDRSCEVSVLNILTGRPVSGATVRLYDFVMQELARGTSDSDGIVTFDGCADGHFVVATSGSNYSYLDLRNEKSLSISNFDVDGVEYRDGIKAFIFGERGVWRPGDTLHISTVVMADGRTFPAGYPVTAELRNPDGQITQTVVVKDNSCPIYHFPFTTQSDAPSGRWQVAVNIGGQVFTRQLRIETIRSNKLDIDLDFGKKILSPTEDCAGSVSVNWLYGAVGKGLRVDSEMAVSSARTEFSSYKDFTFVDVARTFKEQRTKNETAVTDDEGRCVLHSGVQLAKSEIPGMLNAGFTVTAFEPAREYSVGYFDFKMSPFKTFVGLKTSMSEDKWGEKFVKRGENHLFEVATVNPEGKAVSADNLLVEIYRVDWSWWWNASGEIASYMSGSQKQLVYKTNISTVNGRGRFSYSWENQASGLFYVRVTDNDGGHASSLLCDVENYDVKETSDAATLLAVKANKSVYKVGETAKLSIPSSVKSTAVVSVVKGDRILSTKNVVCSKGSTDVLIPITGDMLPNAYAMVTLIQPHGNAANDAPIRLYGVHNLNVEAEDSHLAPQIEIPSTVKPESRVDFTVREKNGRAMSYVVAIVDEGLLSLTGYKTPDVWSSFYAKEALHVRMWGVYDDVIGAYGGRIDQLFAVGGDDEASGNLKKSRAERFRPVVAYLGPFELKAGKSGSHSIQLPQYIGSLRAMVVATDGKAQGNCQKNISVTKPLMVQATLPRTLAVGESIQVPVTLMSMQNNIGNVRLSIKADGCLSVDGQSEKTVRSTETGQTVEYFEVKTGDAVGTGHITVYAESASDKSSQKVEIDVFNPNPETVRCKTVLLKSGEKQSVAAEIFGVKGSNSLDLEVSVIPPVNLEGRLSYLMDYPYGCLEQTVSAAFPQLYLPEVKSCTKNELEIITTNVTAAVNRLQSFRSADGSLAYWPATDKSSPFGSVYAMHFLEEADDMGYAVPANLKSSLASYVASVAKDTKENAFVRAYALYVMAMGGAPLRSTMNLMRESVNSLPVDAVWMLAAAYAADGKKNIASEMTASLPYTEKDASYCYDAYGSPERNKALALKVCLMSGQEKRAFELVSDLASDLSGDTVYMSTQTVAWSLYSMFEYMMRNSSDGVDCVASASGKDYNLVSERGVASCGIPVPQGSGNVPLSLENRGSGTAYAIISSRGIAASGSDREYSSGLEVSVSYTDLQGNPVSVESLDYSTVFKSVVRITNKLNRNISDISLAQRFPSGWEIRNDRVYKETFSMPSGVSYQDFRDDRVYSFFDLDGGRSITITTNLTAAYPGHYYLPSVKCESMYDASVSATVPGRWVDVRK